MLPEELDQRIRAFQESRVLLTAIELDLFEALGPGATAADVAHARGTDPRATEMLLNALAALGVVEKRGGVFRNTPETAQHFTRRSPDDIRLAMMHTVHLWETWSTLTDCVRSGTTRAGARPAPTTGLWRSSPPCTPTPPGAPRRWWKPWMRRRFGKC